MARNATAKTITVEHDNDGVVPDAEETGAQKPTDNRNAVVASRDDIQSAEEAFRKANEIIKEELDKTVVEEAETQSERAKITMQSLGNPAAVKGAAEGSVMVLGYIRGQITGKRPEMLPDGSKTWSLTGDFTALTADGRKEIKAGRLFFPAGIMERYIAIVDAGRFEYIAVEVRSIPAKNAAGYSYEIVNAAATVRDERDNLMAAIIQRRINANRAAAAAADAARQAHAAVLAGSKVPSQISAG
jgi:hypothetical protein